MGGQKGKVQGFAAKRISERVAKEAIEAAFEQEQQAGEALLKSDEHKKKAFTYMRTKGLKHLDVERMNETIRLQASERTTIQYDIAIIKKRFSKEILKEVITKKYQISDIDFLKDMMRKYNVPPKVLQACLHITEHVDNKRMDELFEAGHITVEQLKGCYSLNETTTLKLKEIT